MLACLPGDCDPRVEKKENGDEEDCGSPMSYGYFVSFIFLCSFLVSFLFVAKQKLSYFSAHFQFAMGGNGFNFVH